MLDTLALLLDPMTWLHELALWFGWVLKGRLSVSGVMLSLIPLMICWLVAARGLRGRLLALWLSAPCLGLAACVAVAGPGRLFAKERFEGPVILRLARKDAITLLDIVGAGFMSFAVTLAIALVLWRLRSSFGERFQKIQG